MTPWRVVEGWHFRVPVTAEGLQGLVDLVEAGLEVSRELDPSDAVVALQEAPPGKGELPYSGRSWIVKGVQKVEQLEKRTLTVRGKYGQLFLRLSRRGEGPAFPLAVAATVGKTYDFRRNDDGVPCPECGTYVPLPNDTQSPAGSHTTAPKEEVEA